MKLIPFICLATALAGLASGCSSSSPLAQRAQRADGLIGFVLDQPGADVVRVERIHSRDGRVTTAHAMAERGGLRVSGLVRRNSIVEPPAGSHVHARIVDAHGKIITTAPSDYLSRNVPFQIGGRRDPSRYVIHFASTAPAGSTVQVRLHSIHRGGCALVDRVD